MTGRGGPGPAGPAPAPRAPGRPPGRRRWLVAVRRVVIARLTAAEAARGPSDAVREVSTMREDQA
jgi:hypothetical protein